MDLPKNRFKAALKAGHHQTGFWNTIAGPIVPEALAAQGGAADLIEAVAADLLANAA